MHPLVGLFGALFLSYFASRVTRRLPICRGRSTRLLATHAIALAIAALAVAAIKLPQGQFTPQTLGGLLATQLFWLALDGVRNQFGATSRSDWRNSGQHPP